MAVRFDSASDYYRATLNAGTQTTYTFCCWVKISVDRNTYVTALNLHSGASSNSATFETSSNGTTWECLFDNGNDQTVVAATVGTWHFLALTVSGTTIRTYHKPLGASITQATTATVSASAVSAAQFWLGEWPDTGQWLNGCLTGVKLWLGTALTQAELDAESAQLMPVRTANLAAAYPLQVAETTDYSGNGRTLTTTGSPATEAGPSGIPLGGGPQPVTESGTFAAVVAEVYSNRINSSGDESYDVPTTTQAATMAGAFGKLMSGDYSGAAADVDGFGYDVVLFTDTDNSRQYAFLRERTPCSRFWGLYVWNRQANRGPMVVEAPHPKFDLYTHTEAGALFTKANARAFLLATTHRNANAATDSDGDTVGDQSNYDGPNVFESVHETVALDGTDAVQIHGYGNSTEPDYDIIVSEGQPSPSARTLQLAQDLRDSPGAFRVGVYDGVIGTALGATGNKQGQYSRPLGRYWVHVEQNSTVRSSATNRGYVEDVIAQGIPTPGAPAPGELFDLSRWHLTLPTEDPGPDTDAAQIDQPELATYTDANNYTENGEIVCRAPVQGATTSGASGATRDEYREHEAGSYANTAFDPLTTSRRQLTITTRVDMTSIAGGSNPRKEGIVFQIHGAGDSPIPLILSAEYHVATPRIRVFLNGPGFDNPVVGITPETKITIRCRVESARVKLWVIAGLHTDLGPTPNYDWPVSGTFSDLSEWYFKWGIYNKTTIDSGSTGEGVARISFVEHLQPGDPDPAPAVEPGRMLLALP
jgi:hypothetical protein